MATANELATAAAAKNPTLLQNALVKRVAYCFDDSDDPTDFTANTDGTVCLGLIYNGILFTLDADDSTSAHDGISTIVTDDGYRYHASDYAFPYSVLDREQETPPADSPGPEAGDAYHLGAAPTGDWSGHAGEIAIWTSRGYVFLDPPVGRFFYVEDEGAYYHQDENGDFVAGLGSVAIGSATIQDGALIGGARRYIVENQTTNAPPTKTKGVYYIVGSSPTGDWSGHAGEIATSYDESTWAFITPTEGLEAYDKALNANYIYNTTWVSAAGAWGTISDAFTASGSTSSVGGALSDSSYVYSASTAPTTSNYRLQDNVTISHAAAAASTRRLRISYDAAVTISAGSDAEAGDHGGRVVLALFRDSETSAIAWQVVANAQNTFSGTVHISASFLVSTGDTSAHTYRVAVIMGAEVTVSQRIDVTALLRRSFQIEEKF